jgi:hypothetical protein
MVNGQCPLCPQNHPSSLQTSLSLSLFLSHFSILYITLTLLSFLLSCPILLTIVLGLRLGAATPSDGTRAQKILLVGFFLPNSHTALGPNLLVIHTPLTSHSSMTSCRALHQFHSIHQLRFLQGQVRPGLSVRHPVAPQCVGLQPFSLSIFLFLNVTVQPFGPQRVWPLAT